MMRRDLAFRILARHVGDAIVVPVYQAAQEWRAVMPDHALTYYSIGAMGQASSAALGLAIGRPDKRVIVLDGDGSLLMNFGTLVTIGGVQPKNFIHFVGHNGSYEANGGHPIPNRAVDFAAAARAAGIVKAHTISALADFETRIGALLKEEGPVFVDLMVEQGPLGPRDYSDMYAASRRVSFRAALA